MFTDDVSVVYVCVCRRLWVSMILTTYSAHVKTPMTSVYLLT